MTRGFDAKEYRRALGQFPTGVTVVSTTNSEGKPIGITASSFNSVSMQPPLVLWSVRRSTYCASVFEAAEFFVVNVLGKQQVEISNGCASPVADRFEGINHRPGSLGCPVIADTAAHFECRTWNLYDGGDHLIVVGEVLDFRYNDAVRPLVFTRGSYAVSAPQLPLGRDVGKPLSKDGFLSNYVLYLLHRAYGSYSAELYPLLMNEFGVSAEEWRILTLLTDVGSTDLKSLANMVSQPQQECRECLHRLSRRELLTVNADGIVGISGVGEDLTARLIAFAKQHERAVLRTLSDKQQQSLSHGLKTVLSAFAF